MFKLSLIKKILLIVASIGILSVIITGIVYYTDKKATIVENTQKELNAIADANQYFIENYFEERLYDAEIMANAENTKILINELAKYKEEFGITDIDPFLTNVEEWKNIYNKYQKYYKTSQILYGYHDIILVNANGQVVFSCSEEKALGEHLLTGRLKNTNLANVWKRSKNKISAVISDFDDFAASNKQKFAFIAAPVFNKKEEYIASLIIQIPASTINDFVQKQFDKLKGYECLIVGSDFNVRTFYSLNNANKYSLQKINNQIVEKGLKSLSGFTLYTDIDNINYYAYYTPIQVASLNWVLIVRTTQDLTHAPLQKVLLIIFGLLLLIVVIITLVSIPLSRILHGNFHQIENALRKLNKGQIPENVKYNKSNDIFDIINHQIKELSEGIHKLAGFANQLADNNDKADIEPRSNHDVLTKSLINVKKSLTTAKQEEEKRRKEDEIRNWANNGTNKLSDLLQMRSDSIVELTDKVVHFLVNYMDAIQGGLFVYNDEDPTNIHLELTSTYAYNRQKHIEKKVEPGEGLAGMCALEKQTIYLKEIPDDYIEVTSGLGDAPPDYLLIVPLKHEDNLMGVVEITSFNAFRKHQIEFLEKSGESIAASLANAKINQRTQKLLEDTKKQAEEMAAQEEEMRQNLEEMEATREEAARKELEISNIIHSIDYTLIRAEIDTNGIITSANEKFLTKLGYTKNEIEGAFLKALIDNPEDSKLTKTWDSLFDGNPVEGLYRAKHKDGKYIWLLASFSPSLNEDDTIERIILLANDITEQKEAEAKIKKHTEQLKSQEAILLKGLNEMKSFKTKLIELEKKYGKLRESIDENTLYAELLIDFKIENANSLFLDTLQISDKNLETYDFRQLMSPTEKELFNNSWQNVCNGNTQKITFAIQIEQSKKIWLNCVLNPINDKQNTIRVLFFAIDITEQKKLEVELQEQKEEKEKQNNQFKKTIVDLKESQNELVKKLKDKEEHLSLITEKYENDKKKQQEIIDDTEQKISEFESKIENLQHELEQKNTTSESITIDPIVEKRINNWLNSFKK